MNGKDLIYEVSAFDREGRIAFREFYSTLKKASNVANKIHLNGSRSVEVNNILLDNYNFDFEKLKQYLI